MNSAEGSVITRVAPAPGSRLQIAGKPLLWLVLPLALAAGCASGPGRSEVAYSFTDFPRPAIGTVSERVEGNRVIGREIVNLMVSDLRIQSSVTVSVDEGVITLRGAAPEGLERRRINDSFGELPGVTQLKYEYGDLAPTLAFRSSDEQ